MVSMILEEKAEAIKLRKYEDKSRQTMIFLDEDPSTLMQGIGTELDTIIRPD